MKIEYRNLWLKHPGPRPTAGAGRGQVTYRPGSLAEPNHAATFQHLVGLTWDDAARQYQVSNFEVPATESPR
ncbi:MAG: hypothetical protein RIK87_05605 [Fuerstiella sp.]